MTSSLYVSRGLYPVSGISTVSGTDSILDYTTFNHRTDIPPDPTLSSHASIFYDSTAKLFKYKFWNGTAWEITDLGSGSGLSEPLLHTITTLSTATLPSKTNIDASLTNVFKITLDENIEFDIINSSGTKFQMIQIVITQNGTGNYTITWPSSVNGTPTIDLTPSSETTVSLYNMGDGTWRFVSTRGGIVGGVFSGLLSDLTIDDDKHWNDKKIGGLRGLEFNATGLATPTVHKIWVDTTGDFVFNVPSTKQFFWAENNVVLARLIDSEFEIRTTALDGPKLNLFNNDQTPVALDRVGIIEFNGNDSALSAYQTYCSILANMDDPTAGAKQGGFEIRVMSDNSLAPIIDYSGSDSVFRFSSNVDVVRPNRNNGIDLGSVTQSWKDFFIAGFEDVKGISTPADPASGTRRIFVDSADGVLKVRTSSGTSVSLEAGAAGGEPNTTSNALSDSSTQKGLAKAKNVYDLPFKVIKSGTGISLASDSDSVTISSSALTNPMTTALDMNGNDIDDIDDLHFSDPDMQISQGSGIMTVDIGSGTGDTFRIRRGTTSAIILDDTGFRFTSGTNLGFYGTAAIAKQTGVAVTAAGIHAALVNLGLIS